MGIQDTLCVCDCPIDVHDPGTGQCEDCDCQGYDPQRKPFGLLFTRGYDELLTFLEQGEYCDGDVYAACGWIVSPHKRFRLALKIPGDRYWQSAGSPTTSIDDALALFRSDCQLLAIHEAMTTYVKSCCHFSEKFRVAQALCATAIMHPEWRRAVERTEHQRNNSCTGETLK